MRTLRRDWGRNRIEKLYREIKIGDDSNSVKES